MNANVVGRCGGAPDDDAGRLGEEPRWVSDVGEVMGAAVGGGDEEGMNEICDDLGNISLRPMHERRWAPDECIACSFMPH